MSNLPTKIEVQVLTKAVPPADLLLTCRNIIRMFPRAQQVFIRAKELGWASEVLADALWIELQSFMDEGFDTDGLWQACVYLADEYLQIGDELLLINPETGVAIARLSEDDIYQPEPVARETEDPDRARLAQPLPRMKPGLEAALIQWRYHKKRDEKLQDELAKRAHQTDLLRQDGDPRLLRATRGGRKHLADLLREELPKLWSQQTGASRRLLDACNFVKAQPEHEELLVVHGTQSITPVVDVTTSNLRHDPFTSLKRQIGNEWVRILAKEITFAADNESVCTTSILGQLPPGDTFVWIAPPHVAFHLRGRTVIPVTGITLSYMVEVGSDLIDVLIDEGAYECRSREFLDRWEVATEVRFGVRLKLAKVVPFRFTDIPEEEHIAEVVH